MTALFVAGMISARGQKTNAPARPNLSGRVEMDDGQPAQATVFIDSAHPKTGSSAFCPSCYSDCSKKAKTDANGDFKIESVDPELTFRVLIVSEGCRPQFVNKVNPADGPLYVSMEKRDISKVPPGNMVHGRVLDPKGKPIEGAAVEAHGAQFSDGGTTWGELPEIDSLAVTGSNGDFVLTARKKITALDVKVEAHNFARKTFSDLSSGTNVHDLAVTEGATVTGRAS